MSRAHLLPAFGIALALAGCGGEDKGRPSSERGPSPEPIDYCAIEAEYAANSLSIGSFEPVGFGTTVTCDLMGEVSSCTTYFNHDAALSYPSTNSALMAICPTTEPKVVPSSGSIETEPLRRCESDERGFHFLAKNMGVCINPNNGRRGWGGSFDMTFPPNVGTCPNDETCAIRPNAMDRLELLCPSGEACNDKSFDASAWDGISLWVKKGPGAGGGAIIVSVADIYTGSTRCDMSDPNTAVAGAVAVPDTEKCDSFGTAVTLTEEWTFIPLYFDALFQKGFGKPSPLGKLDSSHLIKIQVLISAGDWDFWIDDIGFFAAPN